MFVDGCFWHGHNCRNVTPADNAEFWAEKVRKNKSRDEKMNDIFISRGWKVIRLWECELTKKNLSATIEKLIKEIKYS